MSTNSNMGGLRALWPDARAIRPAGKCPICKRERQFSFLTDLDHPRGNGEETCGYYCAACGWSNAGSRSVETLVIVEEDDYELARGEGVED